MNHFASEHEAADCIYVSDQGHADEMPVQHPRITKSVGSIDEFWGSYSVICAILFDYCMEVLWNAVFYDTIAEYFISWRRRKLWFGQPKTRVPTSDRDIGKKIEELPGELVCSEHI